MTSFMENIIQLQFGIIFYYIKFIFISFQFLFHFNFYFNMGNVFFEFFSEEGSAWKKYEKKVINDFTMQTKGQNAFAKPSLGITCQGTKLNKK